MDQRRILTAGGPVGSAAGPGARQAPPKPPEPPNRVYKATRQPKAPPAYDTGQTKPNEGA